MLKLHQDGCWIVILNNCEKIALIEVLMEHILTPDSTRRFKDLLDGCELRPVDLLQALDRGFFASRARLEQIEKELDRRNSVTPESGSPLDLVEFRKPSL